MQRVLKIETHRDTYSGKEAAEGSITVKDLREYLEGVDDDLPVIMSYDNDYTFGSIAFEDFNEETVEEDED